MIAQISAGSSGTRSATGGSPPRSQVEEVVRVVGLVEEVEAVVAVAEGKAVLLPRSARAVSNEVMLIVSPDPLSGCKAEEVEVGSGAAMRREEERARKGHCSRLRPFAAALPRRLEAESANVQGALAAVAD